MRSLGRRPDATAGRTSRPSLSRGLRAAALAGCLWLAAAGCRSTPTDAGAEDRPDHGVAIGSILVAIDRGGDLARKGHFSGYDAASLTYELSLQQDSGRGFATPLLSNLKPFEVVADEERVFAVSLHGGEYQFSRLSPEERGLLYIVLDTHFRVVPGEIRYIGRLVVIVPERFGFGAGLVVAVEDGGRETLARVAQTHGARFADAVTELMVVRGGEPVAAGSLHPVEDRSSP